MSGAGRPPTKLTAAKPLTLVTGASRGFSGEHSFAVTTERASVSPAKNKEIAKLVLGTLFPESTVAGGGHSDVEGLGRNLSIYIILKNNQGLPQQPSGLYSTVPMQRHACMLSCFSNPMDCSQPGSSVHGILQARILE